MPGNDCVIGLCEIFAKVFRDWDSFRLRSVSYKICLGPYLNPTPAHLARHDAM